MTSNGTHVPYAASAIIFVLVLVSKYSGAIGNGDITVRHASESETSTGEGPRGELVRSSRRLAQDSSSAPSSSQVLSNETAVVVMNKTSDPLVNNSQPSPEEGPGPSVEVVAVEDVDSRSPYNRHHVCCCKRKSGGIASVPYQGDLPSDDCCCGSYSQCCKKPENLASLICGSGQGCGILLLVASVIGVILLGICLSSALFVRRRRRRAMETRDSEEGGGTSHRVQSMNLPEDQLAGLEIKAPAEEMIGKSLECPICLENKNVDRTTWSTLPCGHGACSTCTAHLVQHASRPISCDASKVGILCPLCRKPAVTNCERRRSREALASTENTGMERDSDTMPGSGELHVVR